MNSIDGKSVQGPPTGEGARKADIGLVAALSIGVGGMIGAGIFSILGVVARVAGSAMPLSFAIGGVVAGLAAYSYVALGKTFPSVGGAVTFLVRGYGEGVASGSLNLFQSFSYIITIALYATGFAAYAVTFIHLPSKVWAVGVVLAFTAINFLGSRLMGRAESVIVIIKVAILIVFIVAAFMALTGKGVVRLSPASWPGPLAIFTGAGILFVGYEGFGLITNAAANMAKPKRELPRAIYGSVAIAIVIYLLVASGVVTNVPLDVLKGLGNSALAVAAKPSLGQAGFRLIAIAALLSTASAVNATLFGSTNIAYQIAKNGGLPAAFDRKLWGRDVEGLFIILWIGARLRSALSLEFRRLHGQRRVPSGVLSGEHRSLANSKADGRKDMAGRGVGGHLSFPLRRSRVPHDRHGADIRDRSWCHAGGELLVRDCVSPQDRANFQSDSDANRARA